VQPTTGTRTGGTSFNSRFSGRFRSAQKQIDA